MEEFNRKWKTSICKNTVSENITWEFDLISADQE